MTRLSTVAVSLAAGLLALAMSPAAAQDEPTGAAAPDRGADETMSVIVKLVDLGHPGDAQVLADGLEAAHEGVDSTLVIDELNLMAADVTSAGLRALERATAVETIRPARQDLQLFLDQSTVTVGAAAFHLAGSTGAGRVVAVIDSGVDADHPGLGDSVVEQGCFLQGVPTFASEPGVSVKELCANGTRSGPSAEPCVVIPTSCTHGTAVAGIISGDDATYTGVAPDAGIIALRVTAVIEGLADPSDPEYPYSPYIAEAGVLAALEHVYSLRDTYDISAVNLSLGGDPGDCRDAAWEDVIGRLTNAGIAVVAASGNSGSENSISFPACLPDVISVGATTSDGQFAPFTSSSSDLDLLAPGSPVTMTVLDTYDASGFAALQGTSFSTPHVAAAFAIIDEHLPAEWPVSRVRNLFRASGAMIPRVSANQTGYVPRFPELRLEPLIGFEPFDDAGFGFFVEASDWAKVTGVSTGISGNLFGPEIALTRAQAVTFLWRLMGQPDFGTDSGFVDVDGDAYYAAAVTWAATAGVTNGTSPGIFSPNDIVTRAQLATFMWRTVGEPVPTFESGFVDVSPTEYFASAVAWMAEHAITTGTSTITFSPNDMVTRAQMITFEYRLADTESAWTGSVEPPELALF